MNYSEAGKLGYKKAKEKLQALVKVKRDLYEKNMKYCKCCGKPIPYEKRKNNFCSFSCSAKISNLGRPSSMKKHRKCAYCGEPVEKANKYCRSCIIKRVYIRTEYINRKSFDSLTSVGGRRSYLRRTREHKCSMCGLETWLGKPINLEVHHIDGNHKNNVKENLCLVCPNCHSTTSTYKAKNKGNGRPQRRTKNT